MGEGRGGGRQDFKQTKVRLEAKGGKGREGCLRVGAVFKTLTSHVAFLSQITALYVLGCIPSALFFSLFKDLFKTSEQLSVQICTFFVYFLTLSY